MIANDVCELIGNTPLVRLNRINPNPNVTMYAKLEGVNPGGSVKDRIALKMLDAAIADGSLTKDKIVLEATSGNTGIAIAMIANARGYRVTLTMSAGVSLERRQMIKSFGAELVLTEPSLGTDGAIMKAREMVAAEPDKYFNIDQYSNPANPQAHIDGTAEEIWRQTEGKITHFVTGVGTSGTLVGVGKTLKQKNPNIKIIEVQPEHGHKLQGMKSMEEAIIPKIYDPNIADERFIVTTADALEMARRVVREESIFVGMSVGAAALAAVEVAKKIDKGLIVVIFPDRGEKYLSTPLYQTS
jgi:cysteine synthase B